MKIKDRHELALFEPRKVLALMKRNGFSARFLKNGLLQGRGLYVGVKIRSKKVGIEKELLLRAKRLYGSSKRKTTDEELHRAGEKAFADIERGLLKK